MSNDNPPADGVFVDGDPNGKPIEENIKSRATWTRLLFMVICCFLASLASFVGTFVVVLGFLWVLFSGEVNRQIQHVGTESCRLPLRDHALPDIQYRGKAFSARQ